MTKTIAIDCDGVLVDTCYLWIKYLLSNYMLKNECQYTIEDALPYNPTNMFNIPEGETGFEWWWNNKLYDDLKPREDAIKYVNKLIDEGYDVIFVSHVIGDHYCSKYNFLNKWFPNHSGIIFTNEKHRVKCNVMIDDTYRVLNKMPHSVDCIKFRMDYTETCDKRINFPIAYNWEQVYKEITRERVNLFPPFHIQRRTA